MPVPDEYHMHEPGEQPTDVLLLPSFTIVENVTPQLAPDLIEHFVNHSLTTTTPLGALPEKKDENGVKPLEQEQQQQEQPPHPSTHPSHQPLLHRTPVLMPLSSFFALNEPATHVAGNQHPCCAKNSSAICGR